MSTVIDAQNITKSFHVRSRKKVADHLAVDAVTFTVDAGRCIGVVGESGSGKTTLARMIVGLETPTSGSMQVCGQDRTVRAKRAADRREWARRVQMVFQDPFTSLDRRQTGESCLTEVLKLHTTMSASHRTRRIAALADQVGLTTRQVAQRPTELSGGQRQRLAIARALAVEPEILVLDESVSALDVSIQAQVLNCLADIKSELGMTYVFVSHDLGVIRQIADDVLVMWKGRVVEAGVAETVLAAPQHEYTQLLKRSVPGPGWRPPTPRGSLANAHSIGERHHAACSEPPPTSTAKTVRLPPSERPQRQGG